MVDGSGNVQTDPAQAPIGSDLGGPDPVSATAKPVPGPRRWAAHLVPAATNVAAPLEATAVGPVSLRAAGLAGPADPALEYGDRGPSRGWAPRRGALHPQALHRWALPRWASRRWSGRSQPATLRFPGWVRGADALCALDAAADAVLAMDDQGRCLSVNAAGVRLFGRTADALIGTDVQELVPQLAVAVRALTADRSHGPRVAGPRAVEAGGTGVELHGVTAVGSRFPAQVWLTVLSSRRRLVVLATVRDLSAQRAAAAATRALLDDVHELRAVVAGVSAAVTERAIVIVDGLGHVTSFNRAAEKLIGRRAEEVVGRPLAELSDPEQLAGARTELRLAGGVDPLLELTRSGLPNRQDWIFRNRDGDPRPVSLRITPIGDPRDPIGFVCVARERSVTWEPLTSRPTSDRLLLDLDDAETRTLRWQVGGSGYPRRR